MLSRSAPELYQLACLDLHNTQHKAKFYLHNTQHDHRQRPAQHPVPYQYQTCTTQPPIPPAPLCALKALRLTYPENQFLIFGNRP